MRQHRDPLIYFHLSLFHGWTSPHTRVAHLSARRRCRSRTRRVVDFDNEVDLKTGDIYNSFTVWRTIIFSDRLRMFLYASVENARDA